jgi:hypothetical protein
MGWKTCRWTKEIFGHLKKPSLKNLPNTQIMIKSKESSWHWKFGSKRKKNTKTYVGKNKAYVGNNEWESQYHPHRILPHGPTPCKLNKCISSCSWKKDFTHLVKGSFPVLGGFENKWKLDRVSSRFLVWIPQGITLSDALYETWL